jgi:sugar lactone lactonase YvrE
MGVASIFAPAFCQAPAYIITTFAGDNVAGYTADAVAANTSELNNPFGIVLDSKGNLYIADQDNFRVRQVTGGTISTVAGNGTSGYLGDAAAATSAELGRVSGLALDSSGNLYIADPDNYVIRKVSGTTITTFAGNNSLGPGGTGDLLLAINAQLSSPTGLAVDAAGNLYIADTGNSRIRKVTASSGNITSISTGNFILSSPKGVVVDAAGDVYIADTDNCRVLKVTPSGSITITTTVTGSDSGACGYSGDGGPAASALLNHPSGLALDAAGNLYIADTFNQRIRRVSAATGTITTLAGNKFSGYTGDGGSSASAELSFPLSVLVDPHGNIYISDTQNQVIRLMTAAPPAINGVITSSGFGGFTSIAPGTFIEIYGSNLAAESLNWGGAFNGVNAPTLLAGTTVTIGGQAAFIAYAGPGQVNALVPSNVGTGQQQITVTTAIGTSNSYTVNVNPTAAGLLDLCRPARRHFGIRLAACQTRRRHRHLWHRIRSGDSQHSRGPDRPG